MRVWPAAALAAYFLFFFRLTGMGLIGPDEPRYAAIGRGMARSGDWVTPRLWGKPWFEKPALPYWMTATAFRLGLGDDAAPRVPVACVSVAFLVFFWWRLREEFGPREAAYAAAVLATTAGWVAYSRAAIFDLPLTATFGAAMLCLLHWLEGRDRRWLAGFAALVGVSMLAKGLVGPALAALIVLAWSARMGLKDLWAMLRPAPAAIFLAVILPWYALCYARNGSIFLTEFIWKHHVMRFFAGALEHNQPVWYFVPVLLLGLLPWTPALAALRRDELWNERRLFFLALWAGVTVVFFSISRDKLPSYILPALPAVAALVGVALARRPAARWILPLCAATLAMVPAVGTVLPEALDTGMRAALAHAEFPLIPLTMAGVLAVGVCLLDCEGQRGTAVATIALAATAGYAFIALTAAGAIDRSAGTRTLWEHVRQHPGAVCLGQAPRRVEYGLGYYAGEPLPSCEQQPEPFHVEGDAMVGF